MDKTAKFFADNLKKLRRERNFTQETLADRLGVWTNTIQGYEAGRRWPDPEMIDKLASALGVSVAVLFLGPGEIPRSSPEEALEIIAEALKIKSKQSPLLDEAYALLAKISDNDLGGVLGFLQTTITKDEILASGILDKPRPVKTLKVRK